MLDHPAKAELMLPQDHPDQRDHPVHQEKLDHPDHPEMPDHQQPMSHSRLESQESQEIPDHKDHPDHPEMPAKMEKQDHPDQRDRKAHPVQPAPTVNQAHKDHPDHQETKARRVSARNTAQWTAVFSSRTEQDDKPDHGCRLCESVLNVITTSCYVLRPLLPYIHSFLAIEQPGQLARCDRCGDLLSVTRIELPIPSYITI